MITLDPSDKQGSNFCKPFDISWEIFWDSTDSLNFSIQIRSIGLLATPIFQADCFGTKFQSVALINVCTSIKLQ